MSAFYVGYATITEILASLKGDFRFKLPNSDNWTELGQDGTRTLVGRILLLENVRSLQHRYPTDWHELVDGEEPEDYDFIANAAANVVSIVKGKSNSAPTTPVEVLKLIHCYEYQSCEHDEWEDSWAHRFMQHVAFVTQSPAPRMGCGALGIVRSAQSDTPAH
jgi:hypothetical protein